MTEPIRVETPDFSESQQSGAAEQPFASVDIEAEAVGYGRIFIRNAQIFADRQTVQPLRLIRRRLCRRELYADADRRRDAAGLVREVGACRAFIRSSRRASSYISAPDGVCRNVTVAFPDYIKNVVCSEIYPTWEESAIVANTLAIISFALNRVYRVLSQPGIQLQHHELDGHRSKVHSGPEPV